MANNNNNNKDSSNPRHQPPSSSSSHRPHPSRSTTSGGNNNSSSIVNDRIISSSNNKQQPQQHQQHKHSQYPLSNPPKHLKIVLKVPKSHPPTSLPPRSPHHGSPPLHPSLPLTARRSGLPLPAVVPAQTPLPAGTPAPLSAAVAATPVPRSAAITNISQPQPLLPAALASADSTLDADEGENPVKKRKLVAVADPRPTCPTVAVCQLPREKPGHPAAPVLMQQTFLDSVVKKPDVKDKGIDDHEEIGSIARVAPDQIAQPVYAKKVLEGILDKLQKKDTYGVFAEPVDVREVPDYYNVIKNPMDFGTMRKKIAIDAYVSLSLFQEDIFLICSNAMRYNARDTIYHKQAKSIQEAAKKALEALKYSGAGMEWEPKRIVGSSAMKTLKRSPAGKSWLEPTGSDFIYGARLATGRDSGSRYGREGIRDGTGGASWIEDVQARNIWHGAVNFNGFGASLTEDGMDQQDELGGSLFKPMIPKDGRKLSSYDENRRNSYRPFNLTSESQMLVMSVAGGEEPRLFPVVHQLDHAYARSLARFAADLGPTVWKVAAEKIRKTLPPGVSSVPGWVGEQDAPTIAVSSSMKDAQPLILMQNEFKTASETEKTRQNYQPLILMQNESKTASETEKTKQNYMGVPGICKETASGGAPEFMSLGSELTSFTSAAISPPGMGYQPTIAASSITKDVQLQNLMQSEKVASETEKRRPNKLGIPGTCKDAGSGNAPEFMTLGSQPTSLTTASSSLSGMGCQLTEGIQASKVLGSIPASQPGISPQELLRAVRLNQSNASEPVKLSLPGVNFASGVSQSRLLEIVSQNGRLTPWAAASKVAERVPSSSYLSHDTNAAHEVIQRGYEGNLISKGCINNANSITSGSSSAATGGPELAKNAKGGRGGSIWDSESASSQNYFSEDSTLPNSFSVREQVSHLYWRSSPVSPVATSSSLKAKNISGTASGREDGLITPVQTSQGNVQDLVQLSHSGISRGVKSQDQLSCKTTTEVVAPFNSVQQEANSSEYQGFQQLDNRRLSAGHFLQHPFSPGPCTLVQQQANPLQRQGSLKVDDSLNNCGSPCSNEMHDSRLSNLHSHFSTPIVGSVPHSVNHPLQSGSLQYSSQQAAIFLQATPDLNVSLSVTESPFHQPLNSFADSQQHDLSLQL